MASPERVQEYLQRHRVGVLFEDLMAKVISDMPDDPVIYLARVLQLRAEKKEGKPLRKTGEIGGIAVAKKSYDKPWTTNSRRMPPRDLDVKTGKKGVTGKPEWDNKTKNVASSFDDIWNENRATRKAGSPTKPTVSGLAAWADSNMEDGEDVMFSAYGYRGPRHRGREVDDPLAGELALSKEKPGKGKPAALRAASKKSDRNAHNARHKAALQQYIKQHEQRSDSGIEEDRDRDSNDDAIELLEDLDDLRREGVRNVKKSGVKLSSTRRGPPSQTPVCVSICARCAKVMGGGIPSNPAAGAKYSEISDYDNGTARQEANKLRGGPFGVAPSDDDEEFESVSQVTGPRRPVWQDSDNEAVTPRKGKHMLASNMSPSKGLPMYSTDQPQSSSRGQKKSGSMPSRSDQFFEHRSPDHNPMRMTWSPAMASGPEYSEKKTETARTVTINTSRTAKDEDIGTSRTQSAGGWNVPPDYDTDSSFYGSPGGKPTRQDRAY